jgi:hypothetical protein
MNWAKEYLNAIDKGQEVVSRKVWTLYKREVDWIGDPPSDFFFDENAGQRPIDIH